MTANRRDLIRRIISEQSIEKQGQLLEALASHGVRCTQATLSRDIKALNIIKQIGPNGRYRYVLPAASDEALRQKMKTILRESVKSVDVAQNLVVVKTLPGMASAAGAVLDELPIDKLVGTLAGDNTVFLAMKDSESALALLRNIESIIYRN